MVSGKRACPGRTCGQRTPVHDRRLRPGGGVGSAYVIERTKLTIFFYRIGSPILKNYSHRSRSPPPSLLSSFAYRTHHTVEYIGAERKEESLAAYFIALGTDRCAGIEAISLDMWPAFLNACRAHVPGADDKMVFDPFHIMRHIGRGVDGSVNRNTRR